MDNQPAPRLQPEPLVETLVAMRNLLLKYDYRSDADVVSNLIRLATEQPHVFVSQLQDGGVWGSAGSLMDVLFNGNVRGVPKEQPVRDDMEYRRLLIRLADEMKAQGIRFKPSEKLADHIRPFVEDYFLDE